MLCIHGHFYQPPRENPWTEEIELQESAAPFHDWNHKIHHECYLPNVRARVLDDRGNILDIVNNLEAISFNFGPTLLSWMEQEYPETYRAILWADKASLSHREGHGNALAQAYSHMIMPLANRRDKVTQVKWGLEDFRHRFRRDPEALWLPETACNEETLEVLVEEGMKYIILAPHQAEAFRPLPQGNWTDVSGGQIDPSRPYRCFLKKDPTKFIDVFFYDGPISKGVGFEDLAFDAKRFMDRVEIAQGKDGPEPRLISVATDGETYGHHKPFGDRVLAYLVTVEAARRNCPLTNYGVFLEKHPPRYAVRLKEGDNGEGTSWSCPHGVKRWKDHCGCRGGGDPAWSQHWRKPLRESLDWLRDELAKIFEGLGERFFKDVWSARNDYIHCLLDPSAEEKEKFLAHHAKRALNKDETTFCLKLLEVQRQAMLMYTSCGWFFTELSGIETIQIIQYAARAIELAEETASVQLEEEFLKRLSEAKSNVSDLKDGRVVYEHLVKPRMVSPSMILAHHAICSLFDQYKDGFAKRSFALDVISQRKESYGNITLNLGRVKIVSRLTLEEDDLVFAVLQFGRYDFRASVKPFSNPSDLEKLEQELFDGLLTVNVVELLKKLDTHFGSAHYTLKDLFLADRIKIISFLTKEAMEKIDHIYDQLYDENKALNEIYRSIRLPIPEEIRYATIHTLKRRLKAEAHRLAHHGFDPKKALPVTRIIEMARDFNVEIKKDEVAAFLSEELAQKTQSLSQHVQDTTIEECLNIYKIAKKIGVEINLRQAQEHTLHLLKKLDHTPEMLSAVSEQTLQALSELATAININPQNFKSVTP